MSNIFDFCSKKKTPSLGGFLKDAEDTVQFDPSGRDVTLKSSTACHMLSGPVFHCRDWSNQELAHIYRVKRLLDAAGVPNNLERGLTDEGDPWCVFCTAAGDVFIHLCKIDGQYVLDSPNLRAPISGQDFTDLIASFSAGALRRSVAKDTDRQVINLEPNGKVFLHPAVLLAALIWSIYLNSEDLVMFAPSDEAPDKGEKLASITSVNEAAQAPLSVQEEAEEALFMQPPAPSEHPTGVRSTDELREGLQWREVAIKSAVVLSPTSIAVGLTSIAIAVGIMNESVLDAKPETDVDALDASQDKEGDDGHAAATKIAQEGNAHKIDLAALLEANFDHIHVEASLREEIDANLGMAIDLSGEPHLALLAYQEVEPELELTTTAQENWVTGSASRKEPISSDKIIYGTPPKEAKLPESSPQDKVAEAVELAPPTATKSAPAFDYASFYTLKSSFAGSFKAFDIDGVTVEATFDIESSDALATALLKSIPQEDMERDTEYSGNYSTVAEAPTSSTSATPVAAPAAIAKPIYQPKPEPKFQDQFYEPKIVEVSVPAAQPAHAPPTEAPRSQPAKIEPLPFEMINLKAQRYIDYLMNREDDLEVLAFSNEVVLIDFAAYQGNPGDTYLKSWSTEDGMVVSTVGLKADFYSFGLIV